MSPAGSESAWLRFAVKALGILLLFAALPCRPAEPEDSEPDDSGDGISMLESTLETNAEPRPAAPAHFSPPADDSSAVRSALRASNGKMTAPLRAAYLNWAQQTVLTNLAAAKCSVPAPCLSEVLANPTLRDAMFAAIYPPDPSILQNYAQLRSELGADFLKKYQSLVIGVAVANRIEGLLNAPAAPQTKKAARSNRATANAAQNSPLVDAIAQFMQKHSVTALDLYKNADQREQLAAALGGEGFTAAQLAEVRNPGRLFGLLKQAIVRLGQRSAAREPVPSTAVWLRHLAAVYEATPASTPPRKQGGNMPWPLFPMDRAPWPLLMPLARPMPLGEANHIWEKFQGQHGGQRYHTYGPYKGPEGERPLELVPSAWHWDAWPDRIVHGGKCITMSGIAIDTHSALCEPSVHAGQPGHANLIAFRAVGDLWNAVIEQAFAGGPDVTHAAWPFRDFEQTPVRLSQKGAGAEYHLGLAQAMNVGLSKYIDTRIAVNLFHSLPEAEKKTLGSRLLTEAIQINPFNPEPWYLLAQQTPDATSGLAFTRRVIAIAGLAHFQREAETAPRNVSLENFVEVEHPKPVEQQIHNYWRTLDEYVARFAILNHPLPQDAAAARQIYTFLKTQVPGISAADQMPYRLLFEGNATIRSALINHVRQHLQAKGKKAAKGAKPFAAELQSYLQRTSPADGEQFLATLASLFPRDAVDDLFLQAIKAAGAKVRKKKG